MRYLSQRYTMPYKECMALLTDIGSEASEMFRRACRAFSEANAFFSCLSFRQFMLPATV